MPKQVWDWTKGITQSAITKFLECREQFALSYVEGITPKGFSVPLEFGTMIHLAIERQEQITGQTTAIDLINAITESYRETRLKSLKGRRLDIDSLDKTIVLAQALFPAYFREVAEDDSQQKWLSRESLFEVPYVIPLVGGLGSAKITLRGMRDGTYRTNKRELLGLFETKTRSQIDDGNIQAALRADFQTMFYLLSLKLETGETPKEVLYNVLRRPGQKFLDRDTYATFKDRIVKDIEKRPSYYFRRYEVNVINQDIDHFEKRVLVPALRQMLEWWESIKNRPFGRWESPYHGMNLNALFTKYGPAQLYGWIVLGKARDYYVRSSPFPELENESSKEAA